MLMLKNCLIELYGLDNTMVDILKNTKFGLKIWKLFLFVIFFIWLSFLGIKIMEEYGYNKLHAQDIEWGVSNSDADFNLRKKDSENIGVDTRYVLSFVNLNLTTTFYTADGTRLRSIDGGGGAWGRGDTPLGGNDFKQPLPDRLKLTYFSYLEDQFYQLDTPLPKQKIEQLFRKIYQGMPDSPEGSTIPTQYYVFDIAIAPQGWIILFAVGPGIRKEIASWQAHKIEADYDVDIVQRESGGDINFLRKQNMRKRNVDSTFKDLEKYAPTLYKNYKEGKGLPTSEWYKQMQTKFPWNLEVTAPDGEWNGEYYAEYANTERYEVLSDQLQEDRTRQKAVPTKIWTWITYKPTGVKYYIEIHMFPIPKWAAFRYIPYYQDPNLTLFYKNFQELFPLSTLARNEIPAHEAEFGKLHIDLDEDFKIKEIYLKRGKTIRPLDGAYEYYLAPIDLNRGGYYPEQGHPHYLTKPKLPDLTDQGVADRD